jgi:hypothetical protein
MYGINCVLYACTVPQAKAVEECGMLYYIKLMIYPIIFYDKRGCNNLGSEWPLDKPLKASLVPRGYLSIESRSHSR